jgi:hypothetical protein
MNTLLGFPEGGSTPPFGRILRQWRGARHLSQLALATEAGISHDLFGAPAEPPRSPSTQRTPRSLRSPRFNWRFEEIQQSTDFRRATSLLLA